MAAQWPLIVERLIALLPTLEGWSGVEIFDGPLLSDDIPGSYVTVGYVADDTAGAYTQTGDPDGFQLQESGEVRCELLCMAADGGVDLASVRSRAFALIGALEAAIRNDRRLGGVLAPASSLQLAVDVRSQQTAVGAFQSLIFSLIYLTVT